MKQQVTLQQQNVLIQDEHILVVKRIHFFAEEQVAWQGFRDVNFDEYVQIINRNKEFLPRSLMEIDPMYKQIIPYLIFEYNERYFLMQRKADASEARLRSKLTLGIGGHIRQEDMQEGQLFSWALREFHEEVDYKGNVTVKPLGIINDDSNDVGKVHIGFVFLLKGDSPDICVKSELKNGQLVSYDDCLRLKEDMETWSQFVVDFLQIV